MRCQAGGCDRWPFVHPRIKGPDSMFRKRWERGRSDHFASPSPFCRCFLVYSPRKLRFGDLDQGTQPTERTLTIRFLALARPSCHVPSGYALVHIDSRRVPRFGPTRIPGPLTRAVPAGVRRATRACRARPRPAVVLTFRGEPISQRCRTRTMRRSGPYRTEDERTGVVFGRELQAAVSGAAACVARRTATQPRMPSIV
jgi:hypothetical protein